MEPRFATLLDDIAAPLPSAPKSWDKNALGDAAVAAVVVDLDDNDVNLRTATPNSLRLVQKEATTLLRQADSAQGLPPFSRCVSFFASFCLLILAFHRL